MVSMPGPADEMHGGEQARDAVAVARPGFEPRGVLHAAVSPGTSARPCRRRTTDGSPRPAATHRPPVPCGPMRLLWPVKQRTLMCMRCMSMGNTPAVCDASTTNKSPCAAQNIADPLQIEQISRQVRACRAHDGLRVLAAAGGQSPRNRCRPCRSAGRKSDLTRPAPSAGTSGRRTELCSRSVDST